MEKMTAKRLLALLLALVMALSLLPAIALAEGTGEGGGPSGHCAAPAEITPRCGACNTRTWPWRRPPPRQRASWRSRGSSAPLCLCLSPVKVI